MYIQYNKPGISFLFSLALSLADTSLLNNQKIICPGFGLKMSIESEI